MLREIVPQHVRSVTLTLITCLFGISCAAPHPPAGTPRAGIDNYQLISGEARSEAGCGYRYHRFEPRVATRASTAIIGHGFLRGQETMASLASALANAGFRSVTLDFCNMQPWNGHHRQNARDMQALADHLFVEHPLYTGFSAGALAATLAAAADSKTAGVLLLDPVDQDHLGARAVSELQVPVEVLLGEPAACNAFQQARTGLIQADDVRLTTIAGASHCEFEAPSNWLCEVFCGDRRSVAGADDRQRQGVIEQARQAAERIDRNLSRMHDNTITRSHVEAHARSHSSADPR